jgi:hypothetical protein
MLPPLVQATAGGFAASVASTAVYPLDLATSRIQTSKREFRYKRSDLSNSEPGPSTNPVSHFCGKRAH